MEFALDRALKELSIDEDVPLVLKNNPKFSLVERNTRSLMGRMLNPDVQKMCNMIHDLPHLWRCYDRVRGYALSRDRFQFIFDSETDLLYVLNARAWTYDDWSLVLEQWIEFPPEDYLQILPLWVRIRNIPVNHYTFETIEQIGEEIGQVTSVAFDLSKSQSKGYVRVQVLFEVSRPLRQSKAVIVDSGDTEYIRFEYERVRKRCF